MAGMQAIQALRDLMDAAVLLAAGSAGADADWATAATRLEQENAPDIPCSVGRNELVTLLRCLAHLGTMADEIEGLAQMSDAEIYQRGFSAAYIAPGPTYGPRRREVE